MTIEDAARAEAGRIIQRFQLHQVPITPDLVMDILELAFVRGAEHGLDVAIDSYTQAQLLHAAPGGQA